MTAPVKGPKTFQPARPMPDWEEEPTVHRLHRCRKTLFVHGFLTETENRKVRERLPKEVVTK